MTTTSTFLIQGEPKVFYLTVQDEPAAGTSTGGDAGGDASAANGGDTGAGTGGDTGAAPAPAPVPADTGGADTDAANAGAAAAPAAGSGSGELNYCGFTFHKGTSDLGAPKGCALFAVDDLSLPRFQHPSILRLC